MNLARHVACIITRVKYAKNKLTRQLLVSISIEQYRSLNIRKGQPDGHYTFMWCIQRKTVISVSVDLYYSWSLKVTSCGLLLLMLKKED